jgi:hypothetical protein
VERTASITIYRKVDKIKSLFKYNIFVKTVLEGMALKGIKIQPYYLVLEQLDENINFSFEKEFEGYTCGYLTREEMEEVSSCRNWGHSAEFYVDRMNIGQKCFGVKYTGSLAAFLWIDVKECNFKGKKFKLKTNEAYFYDQWTVEKYRGKKIASFIRLQCYRTLNREGRNVFFSISEVFNKPAIKFKQRLGAKNIKIGIYIELFKKYGWSLKSIPLPN